MEMMLTVAYCGTENTDYSAAFSPNGAVSTANSLFTNPDGSITPPTINDKYIAGHAGATGIAILCLEDRT